MTRKVPAETPAQIVSVRPPPATAADASSVFAGSVNRRPDGEHNPVEMLAEDLGALPSLHANETAPAETTEGGTNVLPLVLSVADLEY